jgi:hypothetical protein
MVLMKKGVTQVISEKQSFGKNNIASVSRRSRKRKGVLLWTYGNLEQSSSKGIRKEVTRIKGKIKEEFSELDNESDVEEKEGKEDLESLQVEDSRANGTN